MLLAIFFASFLLWIIPIAISFVRRSYYRLYISRTSLVMIGLTFLFWILAVGVFLGCMAARYRCPHEDLIGLYAFFLVISYLLCLGWAVLSKQIQDKSKKTKK
jgi:hypothetical protein